MSSLRARGSWTTPLATWENVPSSYSVYSPVLTIEVMFIFPMLPHSWDPQVFGINRKRMASLPTVFSIAKKSAEWQNVILGRTKHFKYIWWQECYFCLAKKLSSKPLLCERIYIYMYVRKYACVHVMVTVRMGLWTPVWTGRNQEREMTKHEEHH